MQFIQSVLHKLLLAILSIAGVADGSGRPVPTLVAYVRAAQTAPASIAGRWEGTTGQGRQISLLLKADGSALTGSLTLDQQAGALKDGKIEKSTVTFSAVVGRRVATFTGEVAADEITLRLEGAENPVTLKRVK